MSSSAVEAVLVEHGNAMPTAAVLAAGVSRKALQGAVCAQRVYLKAVPRSCRTVYVATDKQRAAKRDREGDGAVEEEEGEKAELERRLEEMKERKKEVDRHIKALHDYNDIKDCTQMLLGRLAEMEGLTTRDMYPRFDLDVED